jgi:ABC-2 type transport system ATP-binding protein
MPASIAPLSGAPVVSVSSLTKSYGGLAAVDDVSFSLRAGTVTGYLGPNGAGKTTTLRLLLGLAGPTAGEALVFGRRYRELEQPIRKVGAVLESTDFHPSRSGRDRLRMLALADHGRLLARARLDQLTGNGQTLEDVYLELTGAAAP